MNLGRHERLKAEGVEGTKLVLKKADPEQRNASPPTTTFRGWSMLTPCFPNTNPATKSAQ